jgi:hypothetical protein
MPCSFIVPTIFLSRQLFSFWLGLTLHSYFMSLDARYPNTVERSLLPYHKNSKMPSTIWGIPVQLQYYGKQCKEPLICPQVFLFLCLQPPELGSWWSARLKWEWALSLNVIKPTHVSPFDSKLHKYLDEYQLGSILEGNHLRCLHCNGGNYILFQGPSLNNLKQIAASWSFWKCKRNYYM